MATDFVTDGKIGVDLTAIYASASAASPNQLPWAPGTKVATSNNGVYMFCRAQSTIAQYDLVGFGAYGDSATAASGTFVPKAAPLTTTTAGGVAGLGMVGISQVAITSAYYGWVALNGTNLRVNALIACQPNVQLFTTGTAGSLDDAVVSAGLIEGLTLMTSATSASAPRCVANWPHLAWYALQA